MTAPTRPDTTPSDADGDGVRVLRTPYGRFTPRHAATAAVLLALTGSVGFLAWRQPPPPTQQVVPSAPVAPASAQAASVRAPAVALPAATSTPRRASPPAPAFEDSPAAYEMQSLDPDDIAAYIRPDDPEPTMAEVIDALNHVGIRDGLGAFSPPGTSPPLQGLAVPEDFPLPEGYVRHHQVTDAGEPIEPILMFSPDYTFHDAAGQPIAMPEDRVVPPELAPPGLPIRPVLIPPP